MGAAEHMSGQVRAKPSVQEELMEIVRNAHDAKVRVRAASL